MMIPTIFAIYREKVNKKIVLNITDSVYTLVFNGNTNTGGSTESKQCKYSEDCVLTRNGFTKTGYHFIGWATSSDGADRTGTVAYLLEGLLGVLDENRTEDFELSTFWDNRNPVQPYKCVHMKTNLPDAESI